ncbi:hypothetical protein VTK26DRAFT_524 [Humicola hyalothermophila]
MKMPSLTHILVLALSALRPLAAAAPSTSPASALAKRADYHPVSSKGEADYCGEAVPGYTTNEHSPLAADCQQIARDHPGPGYWRVGAAETAAAGRDGWVRLAQSGSCAFEVNLDLYYDGQEVVDYKFGTNDLGFYIRSHANPNEPKLPGRVEVHSSVYCSTSRQKDEEGQMVFVFWRVTRA